MLCLDKTPNNTAVADGSQRRWCHWWTVSRPLRHVASRDARQHGLVLVVRRPVSRKAVIVGSARVVDIVIRPFHRLLLRRGELVTMYQGTRLR
jgi:hypothetical protein